MNVTGRTGIKVLVVAVGLGAAGIVAEQHLAAAPSPVNSTKVDGGAIGVILLRQRGRRLHQFRFRDIRRRGRGGRSADQEG
jgi:hypothetical protein